MRRAFIVTAVAALVTIGLSAPAAAVPGQVFRDRLSGGEAVAFWNVKSEAGSTDTFIDVGGLAKGGFRLQFARTTVAWDSNGAFLGGVSTSIDTVSGFSFSIDTVKLTGATLSATDLVASTCDLGTDGMPIEDTCTHAPMDLSVTWSGEGAVERGVSNMHYKVGTYSFTFHQSGTDRFAAASATFGDWVMSPGDFKGGQLLNLKTGYTEVCIGLTC